MDTREYKFTGNIDYHVDMDYFVAVHRKPRSLEVIYEDDNKGIRRVCVLSNFLSWGEKPV